MRKGLHPEIFDFLRCFVGGVSVSSIVMEQKVELSPSQMFFEWTVSKVLRHFLQLFAINFSSVDACTGRQ